MFYRMIAGFEGTVLALSTLYLNIHELSSSIRDAPVWKIQFAFFFSKLASDIAVSLEPHY